MITLKVLFTTYRVIRRELTEDTWGEINHARETITLTDKMPKSVEFMTLWHEALHGVEYHTGLDLGEQTIDILATSIAMILRDNPDMRLCG